MDLIHEIEEAFEVYGHVETCPFIFTCEQLPPIAFRHRSKVPRAMNLTYKHIGHGILEQISM